ncbi:integrase core domain-containing protein [Gilliamella bombi]|uniref:integrase core domain-containing protein n=3 Tax=Gilliamella TaxID=1193503 RepID=UPI001FC9DB16|nr:MULTISPECIES: integrase core domain-containing protein [Gilliamella]
MLFVPLTGKNERYKTIRYGIKRLVKVEKLIEDKLRRQAKPYNKTYPGLPLLKNEMKQQTREYLFVGINDFSRELYVGIYHDKSQFSSAQFLQNDILVQCPYTIECIYSDNGREYQCTSEHLFVKTCNNHCINQKFTKLACPQMNGKAEIVIRTLMEIWHNQQIFSDSKERKQKLKRFINYYNTVNTQRFWEKGLMSFYRIILMIKCKYLGVFQHSRKK